MSTDIVRTAESADMSVRAFVERMEIEKDTYYKKAETEEDKLLVDGIIKTECKALLGRIEHLSNVNVTEDTKKKQIKDIIALNIFCGPVHKMTNPSEIYPNDYSSKYEGDTLYAFEKIFDDFKEKLVAEIKSSHPQDYFSLIFNVKEFIENCQWAAYRLKRFETVKSKSVEEKEYIENILLFCEHSMRKLLCGGKMSVNKNEVRPFYKMDEFTIYGRSLVFAIAIDLCNNVFKCLQNAGFYKGYEDGFRCICDTLDYIKANIREIIETDRTIRDFVEKSKTNVIFTLLPEISIDIFSKQLNMKDNYNLELQYDVATGKASESTKIITNDFGQTQTIRQQKIWECRGVLLRSK